MWAAFVACGEAWPDGMLSSMPLRTFSTSEGVGLLLNTVSWISTPATTATAIADAPMMLSRLRRRNWSWRRARLASIWATLRLMSRFSRLAATVLLLPARARPGRGHAPVP
jgi:hypothetical protein